MKKLIKKLPIVTDILRLGLRPFRKLCAMILPPRFGNNPKNLRISRPVAIKGEQKIFFGENVYIGPNSILKVQKKTGSLMKHPENLHVEQVFDGRITIGNRVSATSVLHLVAHDHIRIDDDVMLASNVFISDALHGYEHAEIAYRYQGMSRILPIHIKHGCWIGQNVVITPGVTIGELSIIGANSVVTHDIPPRCIAVGTPARVIKTWDSGARKWVSVEKDGKPRERSLADPRACTQSSTVSLR